MSREAALEISQTRQCLDRGVVASPLQTETAGVSF